LYEFIVVPAASGPAAGPIVAPATVGVKFHDTPVLVVPVTRAFRVAVCPSESVLGWMLSVTITAP
jgi:hypothetical protein